MPQQKREILNVFKNKRGEVKKFWCQEGTPFFPLTPIWGQANPRSYRVSRGFWFPALRLLFHVNPASRIKIFTFIGPLRCQGHSIKQSAFYISVRRKSAIFVLYVCVLETPSSYYRIVSNPFPWLSVSNDMAFLGMLHPNDIKVVLTL